MTTAITRQGQGRPVEPSSVGEGLRAITLAGPGQGAVHLEAAEAALEAGGRVRGHRHPFEESFFVLSGHGLIAIGDAAYRLRPGDFGFVPMGFPHAWANRASEPLRWLRVRAPQPRPIGDAHGTYPTGQPAPPTDGQRVRVESPHQRFVGHFDDEQLPPPGPLAMPGYHGYSIQNVSVRMMVDAPLGALHHTLFVVEFEPTPAGVFSAEEHFHPFEEIYYFVRGQADGRLAGERCRVSAGDLAFAGVNASHGFTNSGEGPVRWIEAQAPCPPRANGTLFESDWAAHEPG